MRLARFVFSAIFLALAILPIAAPSFLQAATNRKDTARGTYGVPPDIDGPSQSFALDGTSNALTITSHVRCVTLTTNCGTVDAVYAYFYIITVNTTVSDTISLSLTAPFDQYAAQDSSAGMNFGVVLFDTTGAGTQIAQCASTTPQYSDSCVGPVLLSTSSYSSGVLTLNIDPSSLPNKSFQPTDVIFLFATSFNPPNCTVVSAQPLPPNCPASGNMDITSSGSISPASLSVLAPQPRKGIISNVTSDNDYFGSSANLFGAPITFSDTNGSVVSIDSAAELLSCAECFGTSLTPVGPTEGYLYQLTFDAAPTSSIQLTLQGTFNQDNLDFLNYGVFGAAPNSGQASSIANCPSSDLAAQLACTDAFVTASVPASGNSIVFNIANQITVGGITTALQTGDTVDLFVTSNNSPNGCTTSPPTPPGNCIASTPLNVLEGTSALTANPKLAVVLGPSSPIPQPSIESLSPSTELQNSGAFTLDVTGSNFVFGAQVMWNNSSRQTAFVSPTELTAQILAADLQTAGTFSVTVVNPANPSTTTTPNGGSSAASNFIVAAPNPAPTLSSIAPASGTLNQPVTLTLTGTGFISSSTVNFDSNADSGGVVSNNGGTLTITIPAAQLSAAGTVSVSVANPMPGGGTSGNFTFTINNPAPTITSLAPTGATAGGAAFTLTVNGTGFVASSVVKFNGNAKTTTFVSASKLTAEILASDIATSGNANVTVMSPGPGGGTTANFIFTVANASSPVPTLASIAPTSGAAGGAAFTLAVTGTNFVASSVVNFNNAAKSTTVVSTTKLTAAITAADIATAGSFPVTVTTPAPGGGTTAAINFAVNNPVPAITSLSPASATAGGAAFALTVNGSGFVTTSQVSFNGSTKTPNVLSGTQLKIPITAADIAAAGTFNVAVTNAAPGGGSSGNAPYTVNNPAPTITTISPTSVAAGAAGFTLTVSGTNFVSGATVNFNGNAKTTTFVSSTQLTAAITTADIANAGNPSITVTDPSPGGGTSTGITLMVTGPASFTMTATAATVATTPATSGTTAPGTSTVTVSPSGGFAGPVSIVCASLPGVTCSPTLTIPSGSTKGTLTVSVVDPSAQMTAMLAPATQNQWANSAPSTHGEANGWWTLSTGTGFATLFVLFMPDRKRYRRALGLVVICTVSLAIGCGGGGNIITTTPTVTTTQLTVSATKVASSGTITVNATVMGGTPTGNVQFFVDGSALGNSTPVANGTTGNIPLTAAQAPKFLQLVGTHTVSAHYLGDSNTQASNSGTLNVTVTGTTNLAITGTSGTLSVGASVNLTIQ